MGNNFSNENIESNDINESVILMVFKYILFYLCVYSYMHMLFSKNERNKE